LGRRTTVADGDGGYSAIFEGAATFEWQRDVVRVRGPEAERYLQGQLSQDMAVLGELGWAWSLVLRPEGRLVALVRVSKRGPEEYLLDTDAGVGPALVERLLMFKLRTRADVEAVPLQVAPVRGRDVGVGSPGAGEATVTVPFHWGGLAGYDLFGPVGGPAPELPTGTVAASPEAYEAARIEAGFPRHGAELDERTIPAEAGLVSVAVSFTKGCYTGQELVARIDARGSNVPRRLYGLSLSGPAQPGAALYEVPGAEKALGSLTSAARSPRSGWVGLGYVKRGVEPGRTVYVEAEGGVEECQVCELPIYAPPAPPDR
jgi:folate-binding protein YgfZ